MIRLSVVDPIDLMTQEELQAVIMDWPSEEGENKTPTLRLEPIAKPKISIAWRKSA